MLEGVQEAGFFPDWEQQMTKPFVGADEEGTRISLSSAKISLEVGSDDYEYLNGIVRNATLERIKTENRRARGLKVASAGEGDDEGESVPDTAYII